MEEVPPSPEIVKRKKARRKHGTSFTRLSLQHSSINNVSKHSFEKGTNESTVALVKVTENTPRRKLSAFYFDDSSAEIETVDANPLASAILLERANAISAQSRVPSPDFIAATGEEFLSAAELAKRNTSLNQSKVFEHCKTIDKKHNYSFTQLDLDSQMINIFEAAELLACSAREDQQKPTESGSQTLPSLEIENIPETISRSNQAVSGPTCEHNLVQSITDDFSEDDGFSWEVDFSVIKTESLRRRLLQLQDYIASPPRAVKREPVCRRYENVKRLTKDSIARRLSYETDCSSRVEQPLSDDETEAPSEREVPDGDTTDISMDGVALNESVLIQANLTQLSAFFSQAIVSRTDSELQREADKDETNSIDRESPFCGFSPEPSVPISLASNEERSPRVLRFELRPFECSGDDSLPTEDDEQVLALPPKCPQIEHLLDDDEDLFMLAHPSEEMVRSSRKEEPTQQTDGATSSRGSLLAEKPVPMESGLTKSITGGFNLPQTPPMNVCFNTAQGGTISVSDAAMLKAGAMFAEEETKMLLESNDRSNVIKQTQTPGEHVHPVMRQAGSMVEVQSTTINKLPLPPIEGPPVGADSFRSSITSHGFSVASCDGGRPSTSSLVGFSTAGGTTIAISEEALAKARSMFAEEEAKGDEKTVGLVAAEKNNKIEHITEVASKLPPFAGGFNTAGGSAIAISKKALAKAQHIFDEEELKMGKENLSGNMLPLGGGFSTAGGSKIAISKKALERAQLMFGEEEAKDPVSSDPPLPTISKESIANPHNIFDKEELEMGKENLPVNMLPLGGGFSTAGGGKIVISKKALERAQQMFDEEEAKDLVSSGPPLPTISKESLAKPDNIFDKEELMFDEKEAKDLVSSDPPLPGRFSTAGESANSKESLVKPQHIFDKEVLKMGKENLPGNMLPLGGGFSTAGGGKIAISKKALERAQQMFDEEEAKDLVSSDPPLPGSFGTAGKCAISKESLAKPQNIFDKEELEMGKENLAGNMLSLGGGFSTAGGSKIAISKKALERAQQMFGEEEAKANDQRPSNVCSVQSLAGGFSTAGGIAIAVTKNALDRARSLFAEDEEQVKVTIGKEQLVLPKNSPLETFTGAAGNAVSIPANALAKAQSLENRSGTENNDHPPAVGFSNAAGKCLPVSEVALAKARLLFEQVEQELAGESNPSVAYAAGPRKRKASLSQEEPSTPTKRARVNHRQPVAGFQTSTPASLMVKTDDTPKLPTAGREVEQFFAELDDEEFDELFRNQQQPPDGGTRRQNRLLSRFEQCAGEVSMAGEDATVTNTSTSHWDDSFTEILPKLPSDEQGKVFPWPAEEVQRSRREELQKQREFVETKPEEMRRPRVSTFCRKKARPDRVGLEQFLGGSRPMPGVAMNAVTSVTLDNVMVFRFGMADYYGEDLCSSNTTGVPIGSDGDAVLLMDPHSTVGVEEMRQCFLASPGIDPRLIGPGWVENAWRWIVSKLSAMERNFNGHFRGALTPENVFHQLQYRYHVEIDCARRPPLRKVLEKDDIASRRMVLFVSNVFPVEGTIVGRELELSDGWYAVRTVIDVPLAAAIRSGKIAIGTKLMIQGGELLNHKDGCSPLEVSPEVRLKIHANSTRRVRWPVKLGYYRWPIPFLTPCHGIHERGGLISRFRAIVVRVYPLVYVEKLTNESHGSILRSERMQRRHSRRNDASQLDSLHKLYNQIQQELERERTAATLNRNIRVTESTPCSQLQELLEGGLDVSFLDMELTLSQQAVIQRFQQQRQEELQHEINRRVKAQMDKGSSRSTVTSLLKVRLMDHVKPDRAFMLSIWRPTDDVRFVMQEQNFLELHTITANGSKNGDVQLTAHKSSTYTRLPAQESLGELARFARAITPLGEIDPPSFRPPFHEFDTIGVVVHVGTADSKKFQSIYLADTAMELLCVNFWHGLAEYACDDVVHERAILCVANLQWRTIGRQNQSIAQSFATEYTTFTEHPRSGQQRAEWDRFQLQLDAIDGEEFFQRCQEKVRDLKDTTVGGGTPAKGSFSTPLQQQRSMSRLAQPHHSTPLAGTGASMAKRKMETLATIYGSPPKLSPIVVRSNPVLRKGFKTPARLEESNHGAPPMEADNSVGRPDELY